MYKLTIKNSFQTCRIGIKRQRHYECTAHTNSFTYCYFSRPSILTVAYGGHSFSTGNGRSKNSASLPNSSGFRMEDILRNLADKNTKKTEYSVSDVPSSVRVSPRSTSSFPPSTPSSSSSTVPNTTTLTSSLSSSSSAGSSTILKLLHENTSTHPSFINTILLTYMQSRKDDKIKPDLLTISLVLARIAAIYKPTIATTHLQRNTAFCTLLQDIEQYILNPTNDNHHLVNDGRLMVSIFHSLTKLRNVLHQSLELYNYTVLYDQLVFIIHRQLATLNPRSLAMIAWSFSKWNSLRINKELFRKIVELSVTGVCGNAKPKVPVPSLDSKKKGIRNHQGRNNGSNSSNNVEESSDSSYKSPFETQELVMLLTALYTSDVLYETPVILQRLRPYILASLPYFSHSNLGTVTSTISLSLKQLRKNKATENNKSNQSYEEFLHLLFLCADEITVRLTLLTHDHTAPNVLQPNNVLNSVPASTDTPSNTYANAVAEVERRQLAAIEATRTTDKLFQNIPGKTEKSLTRMANAAVNDFPERYVPLPGTVLANILHSFSSANLRAPQLLGGTARYLSSKVSSTSEMCVIETVDNDALANIAWAFATCRYDSPATNRMWKNLLSAATNRVLGENKANNNTAKQTNDPYLNSSQMATCAWASTVASVKAEPYFARILHHIQYNVVSFSLPALAQIVWSCAVQNVYNYDAMYNIYEHILTIIEKEEEISRIRGTTERTMKHRTPDEIARYLLAPMDTVPNEIQNGVRKLQAQLYTGLLGLQVDSLGKNTNDKRNPNDNGKSMDDIRRLFSSDIITRWKEALYANDVTVSKLQTDVSRVLSAARIPHTQEYASPEGLICDILVKEPNIVNKFTVPSLASDRPTKNGRPSVIQGIVIEVQGPTHFTCGIDIMQNLVRDTSGTVKFHPSDMLMKTASSIDPDFSGTLGTETTTYIQSSLLVPTLRTQAKQRWLEKLGYIVVNVNFLEWNQVPSTEEKMELLYEKGIPISKKLLSWG